MANRIPITYTNVVNNYGNPLVENLKKKMMVFMSSCNAVKFYSDLLNYVDIPVKEIHGKQK